MNIKRRINFFRGGRGVKKILGGCKTTKKVEKGKKIIKTEKKLLNCVISGQY